MPPRAGRFERAVDKLNEWVGLVVGFQILLVPLIILYELILRQTFLQATIWANELTVYLTAVAYLMAGGYTLLHRRHVIVDIVYDRLAEPARLCFDIFTFFLFALYMGALVWFGWQFAWGSFQLGETTGTLWNPPIWPVKFAIPISGALMLLQGLANLVRDIRAVKAKHLGREWHGSRRLP